MTITSRRYFGDNTQCNAVSKAYHDV